ncbi:MAG: polysaccharide deacetylase family protein [Acidobacteriota bacterium]
MLIESLGGVVCALSGTMAYAVRGRSSAWFGPSVWRGAPDRPAIALTFDDGPGESTARLLELLDRLRVKATFFQCGMHVRRLPSVAKEVAAAGHEIGNHTDSHPYLCLQSREQIYAELARAQEAIFEASGARPSLFRAPFGVRWFGLSAAQARLGLLGVMWTALARDWKLAGEQASARLASAARNGAIFLLHDGRDRQTNPDIRATLEAVSRLVPALEDRGYHFETVSEILCQKN